MNRITTPRRLPGMAATSWPLTLALALAGCGGGGGGSAGAPAPGPTLTLTGTAATGAAIAAAPITVKCASGTGSGTSLADGSFSVSVAGGVLPCTLEITSGGATLHSLATGSGSSAVANITPLSELIVARLAAADPAAFYRQFAASSAAQVTPTALAAAQSAVVALLKSAGIDLTALGDLLTIALHASTSSAAGDAYDQALDSFAAALAAGGTTLPAFTTAVIDQAPASPTPPDVATLPAELLLQPAAASCSALRSGSYRLLTPLAGTTLDAQFGLATINAATLAIVRANGSTGTLVANGACRFTDTGSGYSADIVVSKAGVLFARYTADAGASFHTLVGFPEQAHEVAELQGAWNVFGMTPAGSTHVGVSGTAALSAGGQINTVVNCENDSTWAVDTCANVPDSITGLLGPLVVNSAGGFDLPDAGTGLVKTRVFAYASGNGSLMVATISNIGFAFWSKVAPTAPPAAGTSATSWNLDMNADLTSNSPTYETTNAVDTVDTSAGSWTRTHGTIGQPLTRVETVFANRPRTGLTFRPAATVLASDGVTMATIREFTFLRLSGMGAGVGVLPSLRLFEFAATEP